MSEDPIFYVYEHWRPDTGVCFYVGKGKGKRAWRMSGRKNPHHSSIVSKLTSLGLCVDVRIVLKDLSQNDAYRLERERIALYGRKNLSNLTDGGEGNQGFDEETKIRIALAHKGNKYRLGKTHTPQVRALLAEHGHKNIEIFKNYASLGPKASSKPVICLDDGLEFPSASAAARHYGVSKSALIELCLGKNYRKTVGGFIFKYKDAA